MVPLSNFINMLHPSKPVTSLTVPLNEHRNFDIAAGK